MKSIVLAILMMPGICYLAQSQDEMRKLDPMVGNWKGEGWFMDRSGVRYEFTQQEEITMELDETALLIKGKGFSEGKTIHNAMAVVTFDSVSSAYDFHSFLSDGRKTQANLKVVDEGVFQWGFDVPNGRIKYYIKIDEGKWYEKGEFSSDGTAWFPFIEFNLSKLD
ncbi:hypothetical protein [Ekhidna sp.]|uniref:hypothetical protein n=1 Tax=Ekhidna sp. TaxID=2608089 RepID=UPI003C7BBCDD